MYIVRHVMCSLFLTNFKKTWIFSTNFWKNIQISDFIKTLSVETELFHADRRTDEQTDKHDKAKSRFSSFYERAQKFKNSTYILTSKFFNLYVTFL